MYIYIYYMYIYMFFSRKKSVFEVSLKNGVTKFLQKNVLKFFLDQKRQEEESENEAFYDV